MNSGTRLPLYSCPFKENSRGPCNFHTSDRTAFLHHVAGGARDRTHAEEIGNICNADLEWMTNLDYVAGAIAVAERERWPLRGLSTTRRSLNLLAQRYNDETTQCLCCFICAQLRTTCKGYPVVDLEKMDVHSPAHEEIRYYSQSDFCSVEKKCHGTLLNNCGYVLWNKRYYRDADGIRRARSIRGEAKN